MLLRYVQLYIAWHLIIWLHSKFIKNTITEEQPWTSGQQQNQKV